MRKVLDQTWKRFLEHLQMDETALVALKGHLLIEEMLTKIISTFVFHADFIDAANLRFAQKVAIARSMSLDENRNGMWEIAIRVNALRNELAHSLQSERRARKTKALIDLFFRLNTEGSAEGLKAENEHVIIAAAIAHLLGFLTEFQEEVVRFKRHVNALDEIVNSHRYENKS